MQLGLLLSLFVTLTVVLSPSAAVAESNAPSSFLHQSLNLNFAPSPLTNFTATRTVSSPLTGPLPPPLSRHPRRRHGSFRPQDLPIQPPSPAATPTGFLVQPLLPLLTHKSWPRPLVPQRWRWRSPSSRPKSAQKPPSSALSPAPLPARHQRKSQSITALSLSQEPLSPPLTRSPQQSLPLPRRSRSTTLPVLRRRRRRTSLRPPPPPPPPPPPTPTQPRTPPQSRPRSRRPPHPRPLRPPQLPSPPPPTLLRPLPPPESQSTLSPHPPSPPSQLPIPPFTSAPLVPGLFVLGDSSVDAGTNNYLGTLARADRLPYGRDFDTHEPTGRFCNGRLPVDFLANRLGLPFVPNYLGINGSADAMIHGVNYASAAAGVIYASGSELGQCISFTQQIQQFSDTLQKFIFKMGEKATSELISRSVFYISIGVNDYIHYYLQNESNVQNLYHPWSFSQFIATAITRGIENLHNMYVRRVVVMGLGPMGCAPRYLWQYSSEDGGCIDQINNIVMEFNFIMRRMVQDLNQQLPDVKIIFCDMLEGSLEIIKNHRQYGFDVISDACCGLGKYNGWIMCMSSDMACEDARTHVWWDQFHPTDAVNAILAENVWNGFHSQMCYPTNLEDIVFDTS